MKPVRRSWRAASCRRTDGHVFHLSVPQLPAAWCALPGARALSPHAGCVGDRRIGRPQGTCPECRHRPTSQLPCAPGLCLVVRLRRGAGALGLLQRRALHADGTRFLGRVRDLRRRVAAHRARRGGSTPLRLGDDGRIRSGHRVRALRRRYASTDAGGRARRRLRNVREPQRLYVSHRSGTAVRLLLPTPLSPCPVAGVPDRAARWLCVRRGAVALPRRRPGTGSRMRHHPMAADERDPTGGCHCRLRCAGSGGDRSPVRGARGQSRRNLLRGASEVGAIRVVARGGQRVPGEPDAGRR
jgi:hypothetical protein